MKILRLVSVLALAGFAALGCNDDGDQKDHDGASGAGGADAVGGGDAVGGADAAAGAAGDPGGGAGGTEAAAGAGGDSAGGTGGAGAAPLEVVGTWESTFGDQTFEEIITEDTWSYAAIVEYDNATNIVITQNPDGDDPNLFPNAYSRIVYLEPEDDHFYYCTSDFGLATLEQAREANGPADPADLAAGCGDSGFSWTKLTRKE